MGRQAFVSALPSVQRQRWRTSSTKRPSSASIASPIPLRCRGQRLAPPVQCSCRRTRMLSSVTLPFTCRASAKARAPSSPMPLFCTSGVSAPLQPRRPQRTVIHSVVRLQFCCSASARACAPPTPKSLLCTRSVSGALASAVQTHIKNQEREAVALPQGIRESSSAVLANASGLSQKRQRRLLPRYATADVRQLRGSRGCRSSPVPSPALVRRHRRRH